MDILSLLKHPASLMAFAGMLVLFVGLIYRSHRLVFVVSILSLLGVMSAHSWLLSSKALDHLSVLSFSPLILKVSLSLSAITLLVSCLLYDYFEKQKSYQPEAYALLLFSLSGMIVMISTMNLLVFFLGLEVMSLAIYVLVGWNRADPLSNEAAIKYFILGAVIAGFFLYGTAMIYGSTSQVDFFKVENLQNPDLYTLGSCLILVALAFKISAVPFHFWAPDVYQGAPTPITGFMSTAVKLTAFFALTVFIGPLIGVYVYPDGRSSLLYGLSILTMVVGNLIALYQTSFKRMMAYSSIAHAGYVLVGVYTLFLNRTETPSVLPPTSVLFYLLVYSLMTLGAFTVATAMATEGGDADQISDYRGLARRSPKLAASMAVFMIALTGIPPTAGFAGKFVIFKEALGQHLYALVIVGVVMSAVSAYYYLRMIVTMYFGKESESENNLPTPDVSPLVGFVILVCLAGVLFVGVQPQWLIKFLW